ncbi:MAG: hypothetical protein JSV97_00125 [candidate division WOR-3 bacterium]|nr:MAG: hypothetical protein JSV97_00125 [candidate division WOR-3 bacterium]
MNKIKKLFRYFMFILIGVNIALVLFGAAMGSQSQVLLGGASIALCGVSIYAKEKTDERE